MTRIKIFLLVTLFGCCLQINATEPFINTEKKIREHCFKRKICQSFHFHEYRNRQWNFESRKKFAIRFSESNGNTTSDFESDFRDEFPSDYHRNGRNKICD